MKKELIKNIMRVEVRRVASGQFYVLVIPRVVNPRFFHAPEELELKDEEIATCDVYLEARRIPTTRLDIRAAAYRRVERMLQLRTSPDVPHESVETAVLAKPVCYLNALVNSNQGQGWLFGSHPFVSDAYQCLQDTPDVQFIRNVEMYAAGEGGPKDGKPVESL